MRILHFPDFDLILEVTPKEWEELSPRIQADLLLERDDQTYVARIGGSWILILLREDPKPDRRIGGGGCG